MNTPPSQGEIGLGDLIRALDALGTDDKGVVRRVAVSLGFAGLDPNPPEHGRGAYDTSRFTAARRPTPPPPKPPVSGGLPPLPVAPNPPRELSSVRLEPLSPASPESAPGWLEAVPPVDASPKALARVPLLGKHTAAGVISAASATRRPGPDLDVPRLVEWLVNGRSFDQVPRLPAATLGRGVHLLIDGGESMAPFRPDVDDLVARFEDVVGRSHCAVFDFEADPTRAVRWNRDARPTAWRPEPGRPVVVLTDLDLGATASSRHRAPARAWRLLARDCQRLGCPLIAFVPRTPDRWPRRLDRWITLIHWDPRTSAAAVRRLVGPGHQGRR